MCQNVFYQSDMWLDMQKLTELSQQEIQFNIVATFSHCPDTPTMRL